MKKEKATTKATTAKRGRPPLKNNATSSNKKTAILSEQKPKVAKKSKVATNKNEECVDLTRGHSINPECNRGTCKKNHGILSALKLVSARLIEKIKKTL
jgi:hypothetical protein